MEETNCSVGEIISALEGSISLRLRPYAGDVDELLATGRVRNCIGYAAKSSFDLLYRREEVF